MLPERMQRSVKNKRCKPLPSPGRILCGVPQIVMTARMFRLQSLTQKNGHDYVVEKEYNYYDNFAGESSSL